MTLDNLTDQERQIALQILQEVTVGKDDSYQDLLYADWDEVPVDIGTFLHERQYLGNALYDQEGRFTLFPYWEAKLKEIFPDPFTTRYNTLVFTGAIGLGKSTIAVICLLYLLYRLLCLKDPYLYYGLQPIDKISISLMNITIENAKGVALDKMNQMILSSAWFMKHGKMSGVSNLEYVPEKHIEVIVASSNNQVIGRAIFCLDGDTRIQTSEGAYSLKELVNQQVRVLSVDEEGELVYSEGTIQRTTSTNEEYQVELEDGSIIKCTYGHRFKLKDGSYKEVQDLTPEDELYDISQYDVFIDHIMQTRGQWGLTDHYEGHHIMPKCLGGRGRAKAKHPNIIRLLPSEHFLAHKLLLEKYPDSQELKFAFQRMVHQRNCQEELIAEEYEDLKQAYSEFLSQREVSVETRQRMSQSSKKRYETQPGTIKGKKAINDGRVCEYIDEGAPLPEGFTWGNLTSGKRPKHTVHHPHVIKDPEAYRLQKHLQMAGANNNMYGKGYKVSGGKNGHALYDYYYKGEYFDCRRVLVKYLSSNVDAKVSESTLRRWERNQSTRLLKAHPCLVDVKWRLKDED